ncbi:MAG: hypothetical protein O3B86_11655 [Planctomycetota bacterium]|nr:hypothetical protein [Planctomycetota bacterium]
MPFDERFLAQKLHSEPENAGALFQVASQFSLLEMISPSVTPEDGIDGYERDRTQGPACAIACGAGTIYRNYFVPVNDQIGQSADNQIDCLRDLGVMLGNSEDNLWAMRNGYALVNAEGLNSIAERLSDASESERDTLRQALRIGLHWNPEVTIGDQPHLVSQAYCSAMPVAYSPHPDALWAHFAQLVLEASYEATMCAAVLNSARTGCNKVYLTLLGGGAFGNRNEWIISAIHRAVNSFAKFELDVSIVSYGSSKQHVQELVREFKSK